MTDSSLAPVALFVYNRLDHTKRTLEALAANYLASETEVYVFSDGGRDNSSWHSVETLREYLHEFAERNAQEHLFRAFHLIERPENFYLERNIIEGISQVFDHHDTIIVLEDDIVTAQGFLSYMNRAFQLYRDDTQVMHVAGFTHLNLIDEHPELIESDNEAYFTPHMGGWGWGTWRDRWQQHFVHYTSSQEALKGLTNDDIDAMQYGGNFPCLHSIDRDPIPWDVCWEIAIYRAGGLCLTPARTLIRNIGLQGGTHFSATSSWLQQFSYDREPLTRPLQLSHRTPEKNPEIEKLFAEAIRDWGIRYTWLGQVLRTLKHWIVGKPKH